MPSIPSYPYRVNPVLPLCPDSCYTQSVIHEETLIDDKPHITLAEAARRLGVSRKLANGLVKRGQLHPVRLPFHAKGSRLYVPTAEVAALLARAPSRP